jgi:hypothetical protein
MITKIDIIQILGVINIIIFTGISKRNYRLGYHSDACFAICIGPILLYIFNFGYIVLLQKSFHQLFK